jgi:hypothetical protein
VLPAVTAGVQSCHHPLQPHQEDRYDLLLAVAAVSGDGSGFSASARDDSLTAGAGCGPSAGLPCSSYVVEDNPVVIVGDLGLVPDSTGLPSRPLAIGRALPSYRLTRRVAPSGIVPDRCCRACARTCRVTFNSPARSLMER